MQMTVNGQRVVMSGNANLKVGEVLIVEADDGTMLKLDWNRPDASSATSGTPDMRLLTGSFPSADPSSPHISEWGLRGAGGREIDVRVYSERLSTDQLAVQFSVTANF